jgi:hypothetical protein
MTTPPGQLTYRAEAGIGRSPPPKQPEPKAEWWEGPGRLWLAAGVLVVLAALALGFWRVMLVRRRKVMSG